MRAHVGMCVCVCSCSVCVCAHAVCGCVIFTSSIFAISAVEMSSRSVK